MKSKKGIELSITMIVLLIISIIIFIGAISLTWRFFSEAEDIKVGIEQSTQKQIESLLRQGTDITTIPINSKKASLGQESTFGLGIRNIIGVDAGFSVIISFSDIYDTRGQRVSGADRGYIEDKWLGQLRQQENIIIKNNKFEIIPLRVRTATRISETETTKKGTILAFNVCVFENVQYTECLSSTPKEHVYGNKIRQLFVEVK